MAKPTNTQTIPVYGQPSLGFKDGPVKPFRIVRNTFTGAGQDSFTQPPAQDPELFTLYQNFLPSEDGVLRPRWGQANFATLPTSGTVFTLTQVTVSGGTTTYSYSGYTGTTQGSTFSVIISGFVNNGNNGTFSVTSWSGTASGTLTVTTTTQGNETHAATGSVNSEYPGVMYDYSNTIFNTKRILTCAPREVFAFNEDGSTFQSTTPHSFSAVPRMANSRDYAYFASGAQGDLVKWTDQAPSTVTNWGIATPASAITALAGTELVLTQVAVSGGDAVYSYSSFTGPTPVVGAAVTISGFTNNGNNVTATMTSFSGGASGTFHVAVSTQINETHAGTAKTQNVLQGQAATTLQNTNAVVIDPATAFGKGGWVGDVNVQYSPSGTVLVKVDTTPATGEYNISTTTDPITGFVTASYQFSIPDVGQSLIITYYYGTGGINLTSGRTYFVVFENSSTGHFSDLSPASASSGETSQIANISLSAIPVSSDPQVDKKVILATADGNDQTTLYKLVELSNATTTYSDTTLESTLINNQVFLSTFGNFEYGVSDNAPPPAGLQLPTKHKGRIFGFVNDQIYFSKSLAEITTSTGFIAGRFEECWPPDYFFNAAERAETIRAILSYGDSLYIGTSSTIYRLDGDSPQNFNKPALLFPNVGVAGQDTIAPVFLEGAPVGAMWLTQDLRVIASDFNTYKDMGTPIQDQLNQIDTTVLSNAKAAYWSAGAYSFYVLVAQMLGGASNMFVFDMRTQKWAIWAWNQLASGPATMLFNTALSGATQNLISFNTGVPAIKIIGPGSTGGGQAGPYTIKTSWLDLGDPELHKAINVFELFADSTVGPGATVTIEGANGQPDFASPQTIFSGTLSSPPLATQTTYRAFLGAAAQNFYRWIRLTVSYTTTSFTSSSFFVEGWAFDIAPISRL